MPAGYAPYHGDFYKFAGEYTAMTSASNESAHGDDRAEGPSAGPDENQLEMFDPPPLESANARLPQMVDLAGEYDRQENSGRKRTDMTVSDVSRLRFLDVGGADPDELRRLEDSIRWLMHESNIRHHLPRAATLPPVRGLPPVEVSDSADSLVLNPDRLFPPRSSHRRGSVTRGALKFLLASAVAAPTAYFIANWMQRADTAAPANMVTVGPFEDRMAAAAPTQNAALERTEVADQIASVLQPEPAPTRAISAPIESAMPAPEAQPSAVVEANAVESAAAPEQPPAVSAAPPDPAPTSAVAVSSPPPSAPPPKPVLSAQEIASLVERGRVLFEAGDLAAARLFFRRAANAGDAAAALAMGATYDPAVLAKRFVRGIGADAEEARIWYEKARELGSPEGPRRIEMLAHR